MQRESSLIATIRRKLPDFAKACADETELVLLHQDAFAAGYQDDEYTLLGMAIKYAGLRGKEVRVIGRTEALSVKTARSSDAIVPVQLNCPHRGAVLQFVTGALRCHSLIRAPSKSLSVCRAGMDAIFIHRA
jgi:hypothetical protein